jgi:hypothetical protein
MLPSLLKGQEGSPEDRPQELRVTFLDRIALIAATFQIVLPGLLVATAAAILSMLIIGLWI